MPVYHSTSYTNYSNVSRSSSRIGLQRSSSSSSSLYGGHGRSYAAMRRSASFAAGFGRGGPWTGFGTYTPPVHVISHPSTPHFMDRYPYVRYTAASDYQPSIQLIRDGYQQSRYHYAQSYRDTKPYLNGKWSLYSASLEVSPYYSPRIDPRLPKYSVRREPNVEDAVRLYKNRLVTSGNLSKYWLSPNTWSTRRRYEVNTRHSAANGVYSFYSRY